MSDDLPPFSDPCEDDSSREEYVAWRDAELAAMGRFFGMAGMPPVVLGMNWLKGEAE